MGKEIPDIPRVGGITQNCSEKGKLPGDTERGVLLYLCLTFCPLRLRDKGLGLNLAVPSTSHGTSHWTRFLTCLSLSFLIYKMGLMIKHRAIG